MKYPAKSKGFTLIEILLVVTIIAILAALVVPQFVGRAQQAKVTAAKQQIVGNFGTALNMFEMDTGAFPTSEQGLGVLIQNTDNISEWKGPYLQATEVPLDPWGLAYRYTYPAPGGLSTLYELTSAGPDRQFGSNDDISNLTTQQSNL